MKAKRIIALVLVLFIAFEAFAVGQKEAQTKVENTFVFTDSCGREVTLPKDITRVAPSGMVAQMIIYSVAPEKMIGWSKKPNEKVMKYFPESMQSLNSFGQFYGKNVTLNMEAILSSDPQVIIDLGDMKATHKADMDAIQEQLGIPVIFIKATIETYADAYRALGKILGKEKEAEVLAKYAEDTLAIAKENSSKITDATRKSVFFGTGNDSLQGNAKGTIHSEVIDFVGAENALVTENLSTHGGGNAINMETLYNLDPDIIIMEKGGAYDTAKTDAQWKNLKAVKNGNFFEIPGLPYSWASNPPSINKIIGLRWLGVIVYPELYKYDMLKEAKEFYNLFYHYDLSDEEANELLKKSILK